MGGLFFTYAAVAQRIEHLFDVGNVVSSNLISRIHVEWFLLRQQEPFEI